MNFLYPIFMLGAAAIAAPIILHMIRRHTHKQQLFSSLMFLKASKPRFQKRSKIEHWFLLLLRCLVLLLLALAFTRPFLGKPIQAMPGVSINRKVILIDTSASMRREGLWGQVLSRVNSVLDDVEIDDRVSVMTFDRQPRTLIDFEQWQLLDPTQRTTIVGEQIKDMSPAWQATWLDQALIAAVREIEEDEIDTQDLLVESQQIILISDLQQGSRLDLLHTFQWPEEIQLVTERITTENTTNASLTILADQNIYSTASDDS
ncbi:BatA domain-containing protein [Planctomycetota bacterium]